MSEPVNACPNCAASVDPTDRYCRSCGQAIPRSSTPDEVLHRSALRALEKFRTEAADIEAEMRLRIQEKIKRWMTISGGFAGLAIASLGWFGANQYFNLKDRVNEAREKIDRLTADIDAKAAALVRQAEIASALAERIPIELEQAKHHRDSAVAARERATQASSDAERILEAVNAMWAKNKEVEAEVDRQLRAITRIQHSLVPISVHLDRGIQNRAEILSALQKALAESGFILRPSAVFDTDVPATEVVFYDENCAGLADLVGQALHGMDRLPSNTRIVEGEVPRRRIAGTDMRDVIVRIHTP